ncbi:MAG: hypothetical protein GY930_13975 [bacterium]|nr:hypothetical protein [bacterium]
MIQSHFSWIVGVGGLATASSFSLYMSWRSGAPLLPWFGFSLLGLLPVGYMFGFLLWPRLQSTTHGVASNGMMRAGDGAVDAADHSSRQANDV